MEYKFCINKKILRNSLFRDDLISKSYNLHFDVLPLLKLSLSITIGRFPVVLGAVIPIYRAEIFPLRFEIVRPRSLIIAGRSVIPPGFFAVNVRSLSVAPIIRRVPRLRLMLLAVIRFGPGGKNGFPRGAEIHGRASGFLCGLAELYRLYF